MRRLLAILGAAAALAATTAFADDGIRLGETYRGVLQLKTYGSPQVPLPPGDWKLVALGDSIATTNNIRVLKGHFIQTAGQAGKEMRGRVSFAVTDSPARGNWTLPAICARTDLLANYSQPAAAQGYDCAWITAYSLVRPNRSSDELNQFYDYVDQNKIKKPGSVVGVSYAVSDGRTYLALDYAFNPDLEGVPPAATSLWHPDRYKEVAKRQSYVEVLKTWSRAWRSNVAEAYKGKLPASFAAAEIFPPVAKTVLPATGQIGRSSPPVAELGKIYRDVMPLQVQGSPRLPLPPGDWKLVVLGEGLSDKEKVRLIRGYLIQTKGDAIAGRVYFNVPDGISAVGWAPSDNCTRNDPIADMSVNRGGAGKPYDCVTISSYPMARPKSGMPQLMQFHDYLDVNGIKRPAAMINVGYGLSSGKSFVTAEYMFNPELEGVGAETPAAWQPERYGEDSRRGAYIEKLKAWAQEWHTKVAAGFQANQPRANALN